MLHPLKVTSTLADETRFHIYEYMLQQKKYFTVQDIADQFHIHPNVARLHLTKLSEIEVITADFLKTGKGGRPGRVYKTTEEGITLTFPKREDPLLLNWTLRLIEQLGEEALVQAKKISYADGLAMMRTYLLTQSKGRLLSVDEKIDLLTESATLIGFVPEVQQQGDIKKVIFSIYNCPFRSQLPSHGDIACTLHESYLRGQMEALFETTDFIQIESMIHDCNFCKYEIKVNP